MRSRRCPAFVAHCAALLALCALASLVPTSVARRRPAEDAARRVLDRGDELRSAFASDAASDGIIANIFESMLDYDYLARPVKLVPRTLEAMPVVEDGGKTYMLKVRKGIYFTPDPAFKGKPRELTAADHAYGMKRLLDPAVQVAVAVAARGQDRRRRRARAKRARKTGKFDYDAPIAGSRGRRPLHAAHPAQRSRTCASSTCSRCRTPRAVAREVVEAYGQRHRRASGRHRAVHAGRVQAQHADRARSPIPSYREVTYAPAGPDPGGVAGRSPTRSRASGCRSRRASRSASSRRDRRAGSRS